MKSLLALAAIAAVAMVVAAVWPLPILLTEGHATNLSAAEQLKAQSDIRTSLVALIAALVAFASFCIGLRGYWLSRAGQHTDRFSRAVEKLSDAELTSRLGGIYALDRLGRDSAFDRQAVRSVLSAFARTRVPNVLDDGERVVAQEVEAAVRVLGRKWSSRTSGRLVLSGAQLPGADLSNRDLSHAILSGCDLSGVNFDGCDLSFTNLTGANLMAAQLAKAKLRSADLDNADVRGTILDR